MRYAGWLMLGQWLAAGLWTLLLFRAGLQVGQIPLLPVSHALAIAFLGPGMVTAVMVLVLALRRMKDGDRLAGGGFAPGSSGDIDQRVLRNTVEQLVVALVVWPVLAVLLGHTGAGLLIVLGLSFAVSRLVYWIGYRVFPPLRVLGFAAGFLPTLTAGLWSFWLAGNLIRSLTAP